MNLSEKKQSPVLQRRSSGSFSQLYKPEFYEDEEQSKKHEKMWNLSNEYLPNDMEAL